MRVILGLAVVMFAALASGADNNNLEDFDVEKLFKDETKVKSVFACLMDQAPCGDMQNLRDSIPPLVENDCSICTPKQKQQYDRVTGYIKDKHPEQYKVLLKKYSPKTD